MNVLRKSSQSSYVKVYQPHTWCRLHRFLFVHSLHPNCKWVIVRKRKQILFCAGCQEMVRIPLNTDNTDPPDNPHESRLPLSSDCHQGSTTVSLATVFSWCRNQDIKNKILKKIKKLFQNSFPATPRFLLNTNLWKKFKFNQLAAELQMKIHRKVLPPPLPRPPHQHNIFRT